MVGWASERLDAAVNARNVIRSAPRSRWQKYPSSLFDAAIYQVFGI